MDRNVFVEGEDEDEDEEDFEKEGRDDRNVFVEEEVILLPDS
jgi:hypothetical protein